MEEIDDVAKAWLAVFIGGLLVGLLIVGWIFILGPLLNQAEYNNYNNSPQHLNAVAQKLSDDCLQLSQTSDPTAKKAVEQDIYQVTSTVDINQVQMPDTTRSCVMRAIHDVSH